MTIPRKAAHLNLLDDTQNTPRLVIVADDVLVQRSLVSLVENQLFLVLATGSAEEVVGLDEADVLLWDADPDLDSGAISEQETPVLALVREGVDAGRLIAVGARGVLYRTATASQIAAGLQAVVTGLAVFDPDFLDFPPVSELETASSDLTPREFEVLDLLSEGLTNKAIAKRLGVSASTVKFHVNSLLSKFGAKTRTELAVRAMKQGETHL